MEKLICERCGEEMNEIDLSSEEFQDHFFYNLCPECSKFLGVNEGDKDD